VVGGGEEDVEEDEDGADGDGGVGDVEGGPAVGAEPDFEEVGDGAVEDAVGDVAGGAAEEQGEAGGGERGTGFEADEEPGNSDNDCDGAGDEDDARPGRGGVRENAESDAGIAAVNEIDEVVDEFVGPAFEGLGFKPGFGGAVEKDDSEGEPEEAEAAGEGHEGEDVEEVKEVKDRSAMARLGAMERRVSACGV